MSGAGADEILADAAVAKALAMVAIEMILTLGHQLGKGFDVAGYAATIEDSSRDPATSPADRDARATVAAMLRQLSQATPAAA